MANNSRKSQNTRMSTDNASTSQKVPSVASGNLVDKKIKTKPTVKLVLFLALLLVLVVSIPFSSSLEKVINRADYTFLSSTGDYSVHFVDVGQGDCCIIELPDNKVFMIDAGPQSAKNNLSKYLDALRITTIDYLCFTHYDEDHIGNGVMIFDNYDVKNVFIPKVYSDYEVSQHKNTNDYNVVSSAKWNKVSESIYKEGCTISYNSPDISILSENYSISFWMPLNDKESNSNNYSPFILVNLLGTKYMFTGDARSDKEEEFLSNYSTLIASNPSFFDVDVFKLGHHGADSSNSANFLQVIKPEYAVASCGEYNKYGHPASEVLTTLQAVGCSNVKQTSQDGSIVFAQADMASPIQVKAGFNHIADFYLEWKYVVITSFIVLVIFGLTFIKKKKM